MQLDDVISFNAAIFVGEQRWQWQHALRTTRQVQVARDVISFNAAIYVREQWEHTMLMHSVDDVISFSAAISASRRCRQWQQARLVFSRMQLDD
eukprot:3313364-Karenia_brevis.AAC.1